MSDQVGFVLWQMIRTCGKCKTCGGWEARSNAAAMEAWSGGTHRGWCSILAKGPVRPLGVGPSGSRIQDLASMLPMHRCRREEASIVRIASSQASLISDSKARMKALRDHKACVVWPVEGIMLAHSRRSRGNPHSGFVNGLLHPPADLRSGQISEAASFHMMKGERGGGIAVATHRAKLLRWRKRTNANVE
ncbi:hypothetical protein DVH24_034332 [Malus domestica]|uniref:Uncharacterized protein n=1 Tax=Malus domestica TaxID=3750 RepID=A0A498J0F1_MALDO|nr:hypothetical protein DVH24_034332 [Malus domestica]